MERAAFRLGFGGHLPRAHWCEIVTLLGGQARRVLSDHGLGQERDPSLSFQVFDFDLAVADMGTLDALDRSNASARAPGSWHPLRRGRGMRKDVREFIRKLEAAGLTVESTPGHYPVLRDGNPLRKANGMPFTLPFSPDTTRWRRSAIIDLRKLGIYL